MEIGKALLTVLLLFCCARLWMFLEAFWWRPKELAAKLRRQGIRGPPAKFMIGNIMQIVTMRQSAAKHALDVLTHDIYNHVLPDYSQWSHQYGRRYVYWWGTEPRILVHEPELIREVFAKRVPVFEKSDLMIQGIVDQTGRGLVAVNGEEWTVHRRVVSPAFYVEKLKAMVEIISGCSNQMAEKWDARIEKQVELDVCEEFQKVTADIISHTAFGSSYAKGQRVFDLLTEIPKLQRQLLRYSWMPYNRLIPFPANLRLRSLQKQLNSTLLSLIKERREARKCERSKLYGNDLLGLLLAETDHERGSTGSTGSTFNDSDIVDECKTFYLAGHETTSTLLSWTVMFLAIHPEWQERARAEVLADDDAADADVYNKFKLLKMILNETLRLYPPIPLLMRGCSEDTQLEDLLVPKGAAVAFPVISIHRDTDLWGPDANEFNPERFKDGISGACKHPNAFLPFSLGPRVCVGQAFALLEAKLVLAAVLRRFSFKLSPNYRHNPVFVVTVKPHEGLPIILSRFEK